MVLYECLADVFCEAGGLFYIGALSLEPEEVCVGSECYRTLGSCCEAGFVVEEPFPDAGDGVGPEGSFGAEDRLRKGARGRVRASGCAREVFFDLRFRIWEGFEDIDDCFVVGYQPVPIYPLLLGLVNFLGACIFGF